MQDFFYNGVWRMDWGLGNPNKTAALIATLMIAVWALAYFNRLGARRWGFWVALTLFTGLGVCLIHTYSRGGLIALFAGLVPLVWFAPRPWGWVRIGAVVIAVWVMVGTSIYMDAHSRYGLGVAKEDRSITNRLSIWKSVPAMMVDAPGGWGIGNSGAAFMQWYQPLEKNEEYRTLVNSHLTWLVEFGWPLRLLYVTAWTAAFVVCWPSAVAAARKGESGGAEVAESADPVEVTASRGQQWLAVPLGVVSCFCVAAWFSSVAEEPWLWMAPGVLLAAALLSRVLMRDWPDLRIWLLPPAAAASVVALAFALAAGGTEIHKREQVIVVGNGEPTTWVLVDSKVLGSRYGRTLRSYLAAPAPASSPAKPATPAIGFASTPAALPDLTGKRLIVCGKIANPQDAARLMAGAKEVVWVNPGLFPQELTLAPEQSARLRILVGEFSQSPAAMAWAGQAPVQRLPGVGDFIPVWPEKLLASQPQ
ncbi:hypothetical protein DB346_07625 [Verrucomicrobia bacterium LW23]|nr:hypothetical protein DB346_07625 [Verrucomicrobia bacterium LW23]